MGGLCGRGMGRGYVGVKGAHMSVCVEGWKCM